MLKGLLAFFVGWLFIVGVLSLLISPMIGDTKPTRGEVQSCFDNVTSEMDRSTWNQIYVRAIFDRCEEMLTITAETKAFRLVGRTSLALLAAYFLFFLRRELFSILRSLFSILRELFFLGRDLFSIARGSGSVNAAIKSSRGVEDSTSSRKYQRETIKRHLKVLFESPRTRGHIDDIIGLMPSNEAVTRSEHEEYEELVNELLQFLPNCYSSKEIESGMLVRKQKRIRKKFENIKIA